MRFLIRIAVVGSLLVAGVTGAVGQSRRPKPPDNAAGLELQVFPNGPVQAGSRLKFVVSARRPGYLILLLVEADGSVRQIYPRLESDALPFGASDESNALRPGRPVTVPDAGNILGNFELFANAAGHTAVVALLSPVPVQLVGVSELPEDQRDVEAATRSVIEMVRNLRIPTRTGKPQSRALNWSIEKRFFQVE